MALRLALGHSNLPWKLDRAALIKDRQKMSLQYLPHVVSPLWMAASNCVRSIRAIMSAPGGAQHPAVSDRAVASRIGVLLRTT